MKLTATNPKSDIMDYTKSIIPILWTYLDKRKNNRFISMNIVKINNKFIISVIDKKKIKRFINADSENITENLIKYLKLKLS